MRQEDAPEAPCAQHWALYEVTDGAAIIPVLEIVCRPLWGRWRFDVDR